MIFTVTLNPAMDVHYRMKRLRTGKENYAEERFLHAGGKGINISRALTVNGIKSLALTVLGKENAAEFEAYLAATGLPYLPYYTEGRIRENITLHPMGEPETRISSDFFTAGADSLSWLEEELMNRSENGDLLAFSGRLPKGISVDDACALLMRMKQRGLRVTVDSNSFGLDALRCVCPRMIKPNEQEVEEYLGIAVTTPEEAIKAARKLVAEGVSETVLLTLGEKGAVWSNGSLSYRIAVPAMLHPLSTVGAGDSTVAGWLAGAGKPIEEQLRLAMAYGTAACMTAETAAPRSRDIDKLKQQIQLIRV